jgi:glycosyltransferase involved in cell wall biosynthesis
MMPFTEAKRIRVLRVFSRLNVGGPSVHVILLTAGLARYGYDTELVVGQEGATEGNLFDLAREKGVNCVRVAGLGREIHPIRDLQALFRLYRLMRRFRPHVVHTHTAKAGMLGRVAAVLARVPVIVHTYHGHVLHGYFGPVKTALFQSIERILAPLSSSLVTVSDAVREDLAQMGIGPASRVCVIPLGLDLERLTGSLPRGELRAESGTPDDAPLVGIVGRLVPIKDVGTFLDAAGILARTDERIRFAVVGDGESRGALEAQTKALGLSDRVFFHSWKLDMRRVYGDLDVVVNCSRNERTPVALIEAMAAGRPVVATSVGGTPDVLGQGRHGRLVPPGDAPALARAVLESLADGPDSGMTLAARDYVLKSHGVERLVRDMDNLYRELLAASA